MSKHCPQGKSAKTVPFLVGVSTLGHTAGKTGSVSHGLILQGGHNITLKEKRHHHECATVKINARDQSIQTQNLFDLMLSGNTIGTLTLISSGTLTLAGGNNITLSQAGNAVTISGANQNQGGFDLTIAGNTVGIPTLVSSGTLTIAGGDNITLSQNGNAITISAAAMGAGSFSAGMSTGGNTLGTSGTIANQLVFAGGNNITLSQSINGQYGTITISAGASILSHDSVYHTGTIGIESQISFDTLSGHDHDGSNSRLMITPQYVEVAKADKQFTSVKDAINSITDASSTKPYVVRVYPGIYTESPFIMKAYVAVIGSGMFNTIIQTNDNTNHFVTGTALSYIRNCAIVGPTGVNNAAFYYNQATSSPFTIQDVLIRKGYYGIWADSPSTGGNIHVINVANWYNGASMHTFIYATNYGTIIAMNSGFMCGAPGKITRGFACDSANAEIYMDLCYFRNTPTIPNPVDGLFVDNGGHVKLVSCTFSEGTNAIHVGPNGTGGYVIAVGCNIRNEPPNYVFTKDIVMDNFGTMQYTGSCDKNRLSINPNAAFSANFTDSTTGSEGVVIYGELWLGTTLEDSLSIRDYGLTTCSTGWRNDGAVTRSGAPPSLDVTIAPGSGYINTGIGVIRIPWITTTKTCTANTTQWIYVDSTGTVTISTVEPSYHDVILLAVTRTSNDHVTFLANHQISLHENVPTIYDYIEEVFGNISIEGCTVTKNANPSLKVDFATGKYFTGFNELEPSTTVPITFTYWYRKASSVPTGWNCVIGQSDFDTSKYDDNSGTLANLPSGKYKKDLLFVVKNDVGTEFHVLYAQEYFDTLDQAEAATGFETPDAIEEYALKIAGIATLADATDISSIVDEKEKFVSEHNELRDLQGGQAKQYYHLNYADYANRNQKLVASLSGNSTSAGAGFSLISTGTMYMAGGNNITISQNANSLTFSGPNIAISGSNASLAATMFTFGNTNGLSFQINNGSVVGSLDNFIKSQSNQALSGSNGSFAFQTATFGNSNELSFYTTNGSMVGSFYAVKNLNDSSGTMSISANNANNISIFNDNSTINVINLLSSTNTVSDVGSVNIAGTGASIFAKYDHIHAGIGGFGISNTGTTAGNTGTRQGTFVLAASGNITASQSTAVASPGVNTIWFSVPEQTDQPRVISLNGTSGNLSLSGASNISVSTINGSTITIYGPASILNSVGLSGNSTTDGSNGITGGGFILAGGNNITLSQSNNTISIHGSQTIQTENLHGLVISDNLSNPTTIGTSGTVSFAGTNVTITAAANNSVIGFSVKDQIAAQESNWIHLQGNTNAASNSTASGSTILWSAGNNVTLAATDNSVIRIDAGISAGIGAIGVTEFSNKFSSGTIIFSALTNITVLTSSDGASQYIQISAPSPIGGDAIRAISGSNGSLSNSTVTFGNSNGLSFYTTVGNSFVGSYTVPIINGSNGTLTVSAGNNINISNNANTINVINVLTSGGNIQPVSDSTNAGTHNSLFAKDDHIHRGLAQFQISGTNTLNTSNIVYGSIVLAGGNSITLSQISAPGGATVTISGPSFSNANNVTFGSAAGIITATVTLPSIGNLNDSSGTMSVSANSTNNISIFNDNSTINVINLLSSTNTVLDVGSVNNAGTGASIFAKYDHIHAGIGGFGISNTGTTAGNTGTRQGTFVLAATGNITASQSTALASPGVNTIWFSVPEQTIQTENLHGLVVSNNTSGPFTIGTSGTVSFAGTNITITADIVNSSIIGFSVAGVQGIAGSGASTATNGTVQFQTGNGITFGLNGNTVTASHNALTSQSTAPSGLYVTNIATTFNSGNIGFSGSNNITISTASQAIIISGANTHAQQTGISSIGASNTTYTAGGVSLYGSGIISLSATTGQGIVISAPGVISLNGYSSTLTISAGNLISISNTASTINIINLLSSATTVSSITSANVIGVMTSRFALEGHQHAGVRAAGVSSGGNISGNTAVLPGQLVFAGGNNITLSQATSNNNDMTITISAGDMATIPTLSKWENVVIGDTLHSQSISVENAIFWLVDMAPGSPVFPGNMTVSTMFVDVEGGGTVTAANSHTLNIGVYTRNVSTLSLLNSVRTTWGFSANSNNTRLYSGVRFITIHSSLWSAQPTFSQDNYYIGFLAQSAGNSIGLSIRGNDYLMTNDTRFGTMGILATAANTSIGHAPFVGMSIDSRTNLPVSVQLSELQKTGSLYGFLPHMIFYNVRSNF